MKTLLPVVFLFSIGLAQAAEVPSSGGATTRWADRCTDFTTNGAAFKDPRIFLQWLDVVSDPAMMLEMGNRAMEPRAYVRSLSSLIDPAMPKNWLEWSNPAIYEKWVRAAAEPDFYTAFNATVFDPGRFMRWVMLPLDGKTWSLFGKAVDPRTWINWMTAPADPQTTALVAKALDWDNAAKWIQAWGNPANYPLLEPQLKKSVY